MSARIAVGTVFAKNYLSFGRVLADSFRRRHPDVPFFGALADRADGFFDPAEEPFALIELDELSIPDLRATTFRYSRFPLSVVAKSYLLRHLLDRGFDAALFLDVDILVRGDLGDLLERTSRSSITVVPHLLAPLEGDDRAGRELNILQSGVFNGGVIGIRRDATADRFLAWWQARVHADCRHSLEKGLHHDQRWLDLVPAFFDDVGVVRDPAYNVAHWNMPERESTACRLFHFSGYDPDQPHRVTRYNDRLTMSDAGASTARLFARYQGALEQAGWHESKTWPHAYERWDNGVRIPEIARGLYRELGPEVAGFGDPFAVGPGSYFDWLGEAVEGDKRLTNLWAGVYATRPDVQAAFPDPFGDDYERFCAWAHTSGRSEHAIPEGLLGQGARTAWMGKVVARAERPDVHRPETCAHVELRAAGASCRRGGPLSPVPWEP